MIKRGRQPSEDCVGVSACSRFDTTRTLVPARLIGAVPHFYEPDETLSKWPRSAIMHRNISEGNVYHNVRIYMSRYPTLCAIWHPLQSVYPRGRTAAKTLGKHYSEAFFRDDKIRWIRFGRRLFENTAQVPMWYYCGTGCRAFWYYFLGRSLVSGIVFLYDFLRTFTSSEVTEALRNR